MGTPLTGKARAGAGPIAPKAQSRRTRQISRRSSSKGMLHSGQSLAQRIHDTASHLRNLIFRRTIASPDRLIGILRLMLELPKPFIGPPLRVGPKSIALPSSTTPFLASFLGRSGRRPTGSSAARRKRVTRHDRKPNLAQAIRRSSASLHSKNSALNRGPLSIPFLHASSKKPEVPRTGSRPRHRNTWEVARPPIISSLHPSRGQSARRAHGKALSQEYIAPYHEEPYKELGGEKHYSRHTVHHAKPAADLGTPRVQVVSPAPSSDNSSPQSVHDIAVRSRTGDPEAVSGATQEGTVYLEEDDLARWLKSYLGHQMITPRQGMTAVDPRLMPSWAGTPLVL